MRFLHSFTLLVCFVAVVGILSTATADDVNPCKENEAFGLMCKMLKVILREINSSKQELEAEKNVTNELKALIKTKSQEIVSNKQQIQELYKKYNEVAVARWPSGSYCIFQKGSCPQGFTSIQGHMKAISLYAAQSAYIKQAFFGNSYIRCHGNCGQYGNWIGELNISVCCK